MSTLARPMIVRYPEVIHIIHKPACAAAQGPPAIVDFTEKLTVYYMVGLPEKGTFFEAHISAKHA